jgi:hypothetical protein
MYVVDLVLLLRAIDNVSLSTLVHRHFEMKLFGNILFVNKRYVLSCSMNFAYFATIQLLHTHVDVPPNSLRDPNVGPKMK